MSDQVFEVYLRSQDGSTYHKPLREGLIDFLNPDNGYRITINIEGVRIILRNTWDIDEQHRFDSYFDSRTSVECCATIENLK
jgi:hypothetical protein